MTFSYEAILDLTKPLLLPISGGMRHVPSWLKLVAVLSLVAEAGAAAAVFWHTGPRAR